MFIHLHVHSHYSLLDGLAKIDELINEAKKYKMPALALTDHGNLYGAIEFYEKAKAAKIKPIIGCEVYLAPQGHKNKRKGIDDHPYHLVLLAKNYQGYKNLIQLITIAHLEGFYYKPRIDDNLLKKYSYGLIALSACLQGKIPRLIVEKKLDQAEKTALFYKEIFGPDFYLELQHHPEIPEQEKVNQALIQMGKKLDIGLVATNDVHYLHPEDSQIQDILLCLQTKKKKEDKDRLIMKDNFSFLPPKIMEENFKSIPQAIANTQKIADSCQLEIELGNIKLPPFNGQPGKNADEHLRQLCLEKLPYRYKKKTKQVIDRLNHELDVIKKTGFASYFLIVQDFANWAKTNGIQMGPGRGSAAGSIVAYLLNITNVDPLAYDLIFERFLNVSEEYSVSKKDFGLK